MAIQKYQTEFALNLFGKYSCLLQQTDLDLLDQHGNFSEGNPCHIYMICQRPRFTFTPSAFCVTRDGIVGELRVQVENDSVLYPFVMDNSPTHGANVTVNCPYPHTVANLLLGTEAKVAVKAADLAAMNHVLTDYLTLDVLYVGQSYGIDGARTAPQRLRNHATLQEIYAKAITNSPDKDIWLLLWSFESQWIACIDGTHQDAEISGAEDDAHVGKVLNEIIDDQLEINLAEAALIRYFQPEYNKIYKTNFPSPKHSSYSQCYDLNFNAVNVEIATDDHSSQLRSATVSAQWRHFATFPFHSIEDRRAMFIWSS